MTDRVLAVSGTKDDCSVDVSKIDESWYGNICHSLQDKHQRSRRYFGLFTTLATPTATMTTISVSTIVEIQSIDSEPFSTETPMLSSSAPIASSMMTFLPINSVISNLLTAPSEPPPSHGPGFDGKPFTSFMSIGSWATSVPPDSTQLATAVMTSSDGLGGLVMPVTSERSSQSESPMTSAANVTAIDGSPQADPVLITTRVETTLAVQTQVTVTTNSFAPEPQTIPHHGENSTNTGNITTPILASIVPLVILIICASLCIWQRRRIQLRKGEHIHVAGITTVWTDEASLYTSRSDRNGGHDCHQRHNRDEGCTTQHCHVDDHDTAHPSTPSRPIVNRTAGALRDYGCGLQSQSFDHGRILLKVTKMNGSERALSRHGEIRPNGFYLDQDDLCESQIGLALTTSPERVTSRASSSESVNTVIRHPSRRLSDPFRDPPTVTVAESQGNHSPDSLICGMMTRSVTDNELLDSRRKRARDRSDSTRSMRPNTRHHDDHWREIKGTTHGKAPSEEIAQRWIRALQMEALQAQEAALEAAQTAKEMKLRQKNALEN